MYDGVPIAMPALVSVDPLVDDIALAMPKSVTIDPAAGPFEQDVVGLDVAVNDRQRVGGRERVSGLPHDAPRLVGRHPAPTPDPRRERLPFDQPHHEVDDAATFADIVDRHDVGMGQSRRRLRFAGETLPDLRREGQFRRQHLHRHPPLQPLVPRAVHHAHATAADFAFDGVGVAERLLQERGQGALARLGHCNPETRKRRRD